MTGAEEKPLIVLQVNGKSVEFLCDSGADRTVIKQSFPGKEKSPEYVNVKSANGQLTSVSLSQPVTIVDEETGSEAKGPVILSPECPINLLGRDFLCKLRIAIIPTPEGGMKAVKIADGNAMQEENEEEKTACSYWWSLDATSPSEQRAGKDFIMTVKNKVGLGVTLMSEKQLHCTLKYSSTFDPIYDHEVMELKHNPLKLGAIYVIEESWAGVKVQLERKASSLWSFNPFMTTPHISLAKPGEGSWQQVGAKILEASQNTEWIERGEGWFESPGGKYQKWIFPSSKTIMEAEPALHTEQT